jgi:hypothetical protein
LSVLSKINVGSVLLFSLGILGVLYGLQRILLPSLTNLFQPTLHIDKEYLGVTVSQIRDFSPNLMVVIQNLIQIVGLYLLIAALSICFISILPYRKGEKWAWYAMLVLGGTFMIGGQILFITTYSVLGILDITLVILWIIGLALPAKEVLSETS